MKSELIELPFLNRNCLTVIPKQPLYDWLNYIDETNTFTLETTKDFNTYLIKSNTMEEDIPKVLKKYYMRIFENELFEYWTDGNDWPQKRTLKLFQEWFTINFSALVYDFEKDFLRHR